MPRDLDLKIRIDAETGQAKVAINATADELKAFGDEAERAGEKSGKLNRETDKIAQGFKKLVPTITAAGLALGALRLIKVADEFNMLDQRIRTATRATGDYAKVSEALFDISQRTGTSLASNVALFQDVARAAEDLGKTNEDVLVLVEAINQLGRIGGASAANLSAGLTQFAQAMSSGVVRAEEMNSLLENIPEVADRIAEGMGMTSGALRLAVVEGKVLSSEVFDSLLRQAPEVAKDFEEIPRALDQATTALTNSFNKFLGQLDQAIGASTTLAGILDDIAESFDRQADRMVSAQENVYRRLVTNLDRIRHDESLNSVQRFLLGDPDEMEEQLGKIRESIRATGTVIQEAIQPSENLEEVIAQMEDYESSIDHTKTRIDRLRDATGDTETSSKRLGSQVDALAKEMEALARETESSQKAMDQLRLEMMGVSDETKDYLATQELLADALRLNVTTEEEATEILKQKAMAISDAEKEMEKLEGATGRARKESDAFATIIEQGVKRVDRIFIDGWRNIFRDFEGFAKNLKDSFLDLMAELAHAAITQPIVMQITAAIGGVQGGASTAAGGTPAAAGGTGGLGGITSGMGSGFSAFATVQGGTVYGTAGGVASLGAVGVAGGIGALGGTVAGAAIFGKEHAGGAGAGAAAGAMIGTAIFPVVGTIIGAIIGGIAGGALSSALSDKTKPRFQLITVPRDAKKPGGGPDGEFGEQFEDFAYVGTPFGFVGFGGKSHGVQARDFLPMFEAVEALDELIAGFLPESDIRAIEEFVDQTSRKLRGVEHGTFGSMDEYSLGEALATRYADLLGAGTSEFSQILSDFAADFMGTADELLLEMTNFTLGVAAIQEDMQEGAELFGPNGPIFESLTQAVGFVEWMANKNESLVEAYARLAESFHLVTNAVNAFGISLDQTGTDLVITSQAVVDAFGGPDIFKAKTGLFFEQFFTPEERAAFQIEVGRGQIERLNQRLGIEGELIDTGEELRAFVEGLDLTTEAGREAFVTAMDLAAAIHAVDSATQVLEQDLEKVALIMEGIGPALDRSRRQIEMSGLTPEQRYDFIAAEIDAKMLELATVASPEEFQRVFNEINTLIMEAWSGLTEDERAAMKDDFLLLFDEFERYAEEQAQALEQRIQAEIDLVMKQEQASQKMADAGQVMVQSATMYQMAVEKFAASAAAMPNNINVNIQGSEVGF